MRTSIVVIATGSSRSQSSVFMNHDHEKLCGSPEWAARLQAQILPVVTAGLSLGQDMLEIGPGPGAATDWLQERVGSPDRP
jgi:hypothetical protein